MDKILIEHNPVQSRLDILNLTGWGIWEKEPSIFPWTYDMNETCYFLTGDVIVTPEGGEPVRMGKGDLVTFPQGMSCTWDIRVAVKKHYNFF